MEKTNAAQMWYDNAWIVGIGTGVILLILTLIFTDAYNKLKNWLFNSNNGFKKNISIRFSETDGNLIELETTAAIELPSVSKKTYLTNQIELMKEEMKENPFVNLNKHLFGNVPTTADLARLQREFNEADNAHKIDDLYHIEETTAHKINLKIFNSSDQPLKNATIEISIPLTKGLNILDRIKDYRGISPITNEYPHISIADQIHISTKIGNINHNISAKAFAEAIRIYFDPSLAGSKISLNCTLHAENLPKPFKTVLEIYIV